MTKCRRKGCGGVGLGCPDGRRNTREVLRAAALLCQSGGANQPFCGVGLIVEDAEICSAVDGHNLGKFVDELFSGVSGDFDGVRKGIGNQFAGQEAVEFCVGSQKGGGVDKEAIAFGLQDLTSVITDQLANGIDIKVTGDFHMKVWAGFGKNSFRQHI